MRGPVGFPALAVALGLVAAPSTDPAHALARVRLVVATEASTAALTIAGATIASYDSAPLDALGATRTTHSGAILQLSRGTGGQTAEGQFDVVLADVPERGTITWSLTASSDADTTLEVYSINDLARPSLVDRFSARTRNASFDTDAALLDAHGAVQVAPYRPKRVLAYFYPWYAVGAWNDPRFADHPATRYSTDNPADLAALAREARGAGIDAFVVSWLGRVTDGGEQDRRMRLVLDAAQAAGLQACVVTETFAANTDGVPNDTDPQTMLTWITEAVDTFGAHPAYFRVDGRPVIFVYAASQLDLTVWVDLMAKLRASGRNPLLVGDFYHSRLIEAFDGETQYTNISLSADALLAVDRTETLRVRTFNLLRQNDRRRVWAASVSPGFDDRLVDRPTHLVVDRADARVYDEQWAAAVDTAPDWVIVTSWNEWFENSEIEPSERYGTRYLDRTRSWAAIFKNAGPPDRTPIRIATDRPN